MLHVRAARLNHPYSSHVAAMETLRTAELFVEGLPKSRVVVNLFHFFGGLVEDRAEHLDALEDEGFTQIQLANEPLRRDLRAVSELDQRLHFLIRLQMQGRISKSLKYGRTGHMTIAFTDQRLNQFEVIRTEHTTTARGDLDHTAIKFFQYAGIGLEFIHTSQAGSQRPAFITDMPALAQAPADCTG